MDSFATIAARDDAPEEAVLFAMGAYDNFARRIVMANRGDLTKSQADLMVGLTLFGTMTMTQASEHLAVSKEQATRAVAPLVERGLVARKRNPQHRRSVEISLTPEGERYLNESKARLVEGIKAKLAQLAEDDRRMLVEASRTATRILRKIHR